ncbi:MAG: DUF2809 domain-containing protein [Hyphomonadaceae bacterium]|nr:DUF2809 domain-containing protein [Hyphomonadaceae bacterium]
MQFPTRTAYALAALILLAIEVLISLFVHDAFVRPYVGDVLAVMLVYTALRAATPLRLIPAITITLAIAVAIEMAQVFNLLDATGLRSNQVARIALGGVFDWMDLAAYATGAFIVFVIEATLRRRPPRQ